MESLEGAKFIECNSSDKDSLNALKKEEFEVIVDFPGTAKCVWDVLADSVSHIIACGSLWMYGYPSIVPTPERSFEECFYKGYAIRYEQILSMIAQSGKQKASFTAIMPPNICGPGKIPIDQYGGRSLERHKKMQAGETVYLPDGAECLISPSDAEDVAQVFALAIENREVSAGQIFNAGPAYALVASEFIRAYSKIYGVEIPVKRVSWEKYITEVNPDQIDWWHFYAPMCPDISKARKLLGYEPKYTPEQTLQRAVEWMKAEKLL
jgi:nucleoside-diphosphate-sugar epimerase